ncbi:MAG: hypothetical protein Q9191_003280 [Dirinaria sp. TL-2023a]
MAKLERTGCPEVHKVFPQENNGSSAPLQLHRDGMRQGYHLESAPDVERQPKAQEKDPALPDNYPDRMAILHFSPNDPESPYNWSSV